VVTDREGFFEAWIEPPGPLPAEGYLRDATFELIAPHAAKQERTRFEGHVVVPSDEATLGVISDVDDTVLVTEATSTLSLLRKILFGNARTRLPFRGVAGFYHALHRGVNPVFYVSSSPWNLYDLLVDFLDLNDIPTGPLMLRDWGVSATELLPTKHADHKHEAIEAILATYPDLPFLLIGDSGQEDPEIYREAVARHPGQIRGIYIRDVTGEAKRRTAIQELAAEMETHDVPLVLVADTLEAARHAAERGWIEASAVDEVEAAVAAEDAKG
jgi:phosphatidate phosphatase APP1